ncbi:MAG: WD40 repeat domain-containing protein [Anaerolineales bacterium]
MDSIKSHTMVGLLPILITIALVVLMTACMQAQAVLNTLSPGQSYAISNGEIRSTASLTTVSSPSQTPVPSPGTTTSPHVIEVGNAGQVAEIDRLGKGTILAAPLSSPDGTWLAVPTSTGVYLYDAHTLQEMQRLPAATGFIAFSPDSQLLATSGREKISLWDPASGDLLFELQGDPGVVYWEVTFSPDSSLLAATSWDREVLVWSLEDGKQRFTFPGDRLQFSPDGQQAVVVTLGEDKVYLYETQGGNEVNKWDFHQAGFTPGGQLWLADQESVRLADIERDLMGAPYQGAQPAFSPDGALMALYDQEQVSVYDHQAGRRKMILEGKFVRVEKILFSPDGKTLSGDVFTLRCPTCSEIDGLDHYLVVWSAQDGSILEQLPQPDYLGMLSYSADGRQLILAELESFQVLEIANGSPLALEEGFTAPVGGMALSPGGRTLAVAYNREPYALRFWSLDDGVVEREWFGQPGGVMIDDIAVAYSLDEKYLAVGNDLWVLGPGPGTETKISLDTTCWTYHVAFSPRENSLSTGCFDGQLDLWQIPQGILEKSLRGFSSWVNEMAFSPDGDFLAAIYNVPDYLVQVWQLPGGNPAFSLEGGHFTRVTYSPDGLLLGTVLANPEYDQYGWPAGIVQLWSASDGEELVQLEVEDAVSIAFSPDSLLMATGSLDGTLRLWEAATGRLLLESSGHYERIQRLAFTPDGTSLVSGSQDGTILLWGIPGQP